MKKNLNLITFFLAVIIVYLFFYQLLPVYKETISSIKLYNAKKAERDSLVSLKNNFSKIEQDPAMQELLKNREKLSYYLPQESFVEKIIYDLVQIYQISNLRTFPGINYSFSQPDFSLPISLPVQVKVISFSLNESLNYPALISLLNSLYNNVRIFNIKNISIVKDEEKSLLNVGILVDAYYLEKK